MHAWAALKVFELDGGTDFTFLARIFHKLLINFTWWVDNKDHGGNNLFQGGFMGLDNIAPLDRSTLPPSEGYLEQADSTAWMAMYAQDLLEMALRLAMHNKSYEDVATKFFEHFLAIAGAANNAGLWDEQDSYFYDVLHLADGTDIPIKVKSLVGLVPISAALSYDGLTAARSAAGLPGQGELVPGRTIPNTVQLFHIRDIAGERHRLLALVPPERLVRLLDSVFEEEGLLSDYGIRAISAWHREHPFSVQVGGMTASVDYEPAESTTNLFGGNSNWRGPIWMPLNVLLVEALRNYDDLAPGEVTVEYPAGSGSRRTLSAAADDISRRLTSIFLPGPERPAARARLVRPAGHRCPVEGQHPVPRVLPRRYRDGPGRRAPDRLDGAGRPPDPHHPTDHHATEPTHPSNPPPEKQEYIA